VIVCLPERVPGGPKPIDAECSAAAMEAPALDDAGLPAPVADTRHKLVDAAIACDYDALAALFAEEGPYLGDGIVPPPQSGASLVDRWRDSEAREEPALAALVSTLASGWMCGPELGAVVEERTGDACVFVSGGSGSVDRGAYVAVIGLRGRFFGQGSNAEAQGDALQWWADTVTGDRPADAYTTGGDGVGQLPGGWPLGVPPAAVLAED
jgi:hypothetical protein